MNLRYASNIYFGNTAFSYDKNGRRANYDGVSKSFRTESITKYTLTTINTRWEATQRGYGDRTHRLTNKTAIRLHLAAESCTICSSRSRLPVRKLFDTLVPWLHTSVRLRLQINKTTKHVRLLSKHTLILQNRAMHLPTASGLYACYQFIHETLKGKGKAILCLTKCHGIKTHPILN
jgi:hypothetical protein